MSHSKNAKLMNKDDYSRRPPREHIYKTPDAFLGSDQWVPRKEQLYDFENKKIVLGEINIPAAMVQLFVELISNSADNVIRSWEHDIPAHPKGKCAIEVFMNNQWITIRNYGEPMPVEVKTYEYEKVSYTKWVPEFIMTDLLTSSNYDGNKKRHGAGKNGFGAKLVGIFAKQFLYQIEDGFRGKRYKQLVRENLTIIDPPTIEDIPIGSESSTTISYLLDFQRFGMDPNVGYDNTMMSVIANRVLGTSFTLKVPTSFNGLEFSYFHIKEYGRLIFGDMVDNCIIHYELDNPEVEEIRNKKINGILTPTPVMKKGQPKRVVIPDTEVLILDTSYDSEGGKVVSFANSVPTTKGGIHVKKFYDVVIPAILDKVNEVPPKVDLKKLKGKALRIAAAKAKVKAKAKAEKEKTTKDTQKRMMKREDVKPYISGIINCRVEDPSYPNQVKDELAHPAPKLVLTESEIKSIVGWDLVKKLKSHLDIMRRYILTKTDGRKVKHIKIKNGFDAYYAGTENSKSCVLWIVEGKSAKAYAMSLISLIPNGRDFIGVVAIRGKFINVLKAEPEQLLENHEVKLLKEVLGLSNKEGVKYDNPDNFSQLRYGSVMIMADADKDGSHIKGLLANFFYGLWPELLHLGYLIDYRTKFLKATKGKGANKIVKKFFTEYEFEQWKLVTPDWNHKNASGKGIWDFDYFKGLGTAEKADVKEDRENLKTVQFVFDKDAGRMFEVSFGKHNADARKEWITILRNNQDKSYELTTQLNYTTFFNREFIGYVMESLQRAIPTASDGLKRVHKQILHATMKRWSESSEMKKFKLAQFSGYIAQHVEYQHNEECISKAIVIMARNFIGSNNIQLLMDRGQFGTRFYGGDDASAARYIFTSPSKYLYKIFRSEDLPILKYHDDDGVQVEPVAYYPIIPMALVNGVQGIATGYSTNIMNYNPIELIDWIILYLYNKYYSNGNAKILPVLVPWFRGYEGKITLVRDAEAEDDDEQVIREEAEIDDLRSEDDLELPGTIGDSPRADGESKVRYDKVIIEGKFEVLDKKRIHVSELPIGKWTINYYYFLQELLDLKLIKDFHDRSTDEKIDIEITGLERPSMKKLGLIRKISLSNMLFLDEDGVPTKYNKLEDYLEYFIKIRLNKYVQRKKSQQEDLAQQISKLNDIIRLVTAIVIDKTLIIGDRPLSSVIDDMKRMGFSQKLSEKLLDEVNLKKLTREKLEKMIEKKKSIEAKLDKYNTLHPTQIWHAELIELRDILVKDPTMMRTEPGFIMTYKQSKEIEEKDPDMEPETTEITETTIAI